MKKLIVLVLCLALSLTLISCAGNGAEQENGKTESGEVDTSIKLTDMIANICDGVDLPVSDVFELDDSNFEAFSFVKWEDGIEAVCSEAQISTSAHSLVLIRTEQAKAEELAKAIADKANVRKWVCVQSEIGKVLYANGYVLLMLTFENAFDGLKANFEKAVGTSDITVLNVKSAESEF